MSASVAAGARDQPDLVQDLVKRVHAGILSGTFPIGSRLRQEMLAERFGVSRTPIREALRTLQAMGVVVLVPQRGAVVRGPTPTEIREAYAVRAELEGLGAELAAQRAQPRDHARLARAAGLFDAAARELTEHGVSAASGRRAWTEANDTFHEAVLKAAGNERLAAIVSELHRSFPRSLTWGAIRDEPTLVHENVLQHERVRVAIERGDPAASRRWMTDHVRRAGELVADWFERARRDGPIPDE
ncbi:MAG TPA: GntR family transcriptional regulator [Solirubrobacteraceae bacterium]|jgi:DNA-binding GntR family transcriptional regulator|nr:GntR family transcriptional regulator [Solirubrobacteraceae bacterium]